MKILIPSWTVSVRCLNHEVKLLVTDRSTSWDLLKARLPEPCHPRALLSLCEALALWHGSPLCAAVSAAADGRACFEQVFYAGGDVEPLSPLVALEIRHPRRRARGAAASRGLGDFSELRVVEDER